MAAAKISLGSARRFLGIESAIVLSFTLTLLISMTHGSAPLSPLGKTQAVEKRTHISALDIANLIVSPMTRTLQTATLIFEDIHPVSINAAIREQLTHSCDMGRAPHHLANDYPHLDFAHLDECWWHNGEKITSDTL